LLFWWLFTINRAHLTWRCAKLAAVSYNVILRCAAWTSLARSKLRSLRDIAQRRLGRILSTRFGYHLVELLKHMRRHVLSWLFHWIATAANVSECKETDLVGLVGSHAAAISCWILTLPAIWELFAWCGTELEAPVASWSSHQVCISRAAWGLTSRWHLGRLQWSLICSGRSADT